jgi:hypothetical protein
MRNDKGLDVLRRRAWKLIAAEHTGTVRSGTQCPAMT